MVAYPWLSYRTHAQGEANPLSPPHPLHRALAAADAERQRAYRALFRAEREPGLVDAIRPATTPWAMPIAGRRSPGHWVGGHYRPRPAPKQSTPESQKPFREEVIVVCPLFYYHLLFTLFCGSL